MNEMERCIYCGVIAECKEHVIPIAFSSSVVGKRKHALRGQKENVVPSCNECNGLAGSRSFENIYEKKAYIQGALSWKYRKILNYPLWREAEIEEMAPKFKRVIKLRTLAKKVINNRLNYPDIDYDEFKDAQEIWKLLAALLREEERD